MIKLLKFVFIFTLTVFFNMTTASLSMASDDYSLDLDLLPGGYTWVKGDVNKFRSRNWTNDGYRGGLKDLTFKGDLTDKTKVTFEGHVFPKSNDVGADLELSNENVGDFRVDYSTFRKYYDGSGGTFKYFPTFKSTPELNQDLEMDMGHVLMSFSPVLKIGNWEDLNLSYERHTKNGTKSRLTWAAVTDGTARNISPAFQDVDEIADTITLSGNTTFAGFDVMGKQVYEAVSIDTMREERSLNLASTASSTNLIRRQYQEPSSDMGLSLLQGEKWFNNDKSFVSMAYRFQKVNSQESENIYEMDLNGNVKNFSSNAEQVRGASSEAEINAHTLLSQYMTQLSKDLNFTAKFKTELQKRDGKSIYPKDRTPNSAGGSTPDGTTEAIDYSEARNSNFIWGENLGLRYSGISKTSLYADFEGSQTKGNIREQQFNQASAFQWERDTNTHITKAVWTVGGKYVPVSQFYTTMQYRNRLESNKYEDKRDTESAINSAFVDSMYLAAHEASTKLTWKPNQKVQTSFRYQLADNRYDLRVEGQAEQQARMLSNTFTYDVNVFPTERIMFDASYSMQKAGTKTAAGAIPLNSAGAAGFNSDVNTVLLGASFTQNENLNYSSTAYYSWADNFNDYSTQALPLGTNYRELRVDLSMQLRPKNKDITIEPRYEYANYDSDSVVDTSSYTAHSLWLELSTKW